MHVIPIAIVVIGILLALVMRSLVAPVYLIASVGLSYLAALGLSVLIFVKIAGDGGLTFILPFLMFIFLLALGEDYNILVMSRIREEAHHYPAPRGGEPRDRGHRDHGHVGGHGAGRHVRGLRGRRRARLGRQPDPRRRCRPRARACSWTRSWSVPCSSRPPWCCSAAGTGGRPGSAASRPTVPGTRGTAAEGRGAVPATDRPDQTVRPRPDRTVRPRPDRIWCTPRPGRADPGPGDALLRAGRARRGSRRRKHGPVGGNPGAGTGGGARGARCARRRADVPLSCRPEESRGELGTCRAGCWPDSL